MSLPVGVGRAPFMPQTIQKRVAHHGGFSGREPQKRAWLQAFVVVRCRALPVTARFPKLRVVGSSPIARFTHCSCGIQRSGGRGVRPLVRDVVGWGAGWLTVRELDGFVTYGSGHAPARRDTPRWPSPELDLRVGPICRVYAVRTSRNRGEFQQPAEQGGGSMTDRKLAAIIALWLIAFLLLPLAWASVRGFDPTFCDAHQVCDWRKA